MLVNNMHPPRIFFDIPANVLAVMPNYGMG